MRSVRARLACCVDASGGRLAARLGLRGDIRRKPHARAAFLPMARSLLRRSVRGEKGGAMKKILIATDGSEPSKEAVEFGLELATEQNADVTFVHVVPADYFYAGRLGPAIPMQHEEPIDEFERALNEAAEAAKAVGVPYTLERISA